MGRMPVQANELPRKRERLTAGERREGRAMPGGLVQHPGRIALGAGLVMALLIASSVVATFVYLAAEDDRVRAYARLVMVDSEDNLPTFFNFVLLAGLLFLLASRTLEAFASADRWRGYWLGLALIFLVLAFDESGQLHENLVGVGSFSGASSYFYFGWVIPAGIVVLAVGLCYLRFVLALPRPEGALTIIGGSLYLAGAIGTEMVGGDRAWQRSLGDPTSLLVAMEDATYLLIATLEETLEMAGLIVFGYALLRLRAGSDGTIRIRSSV